MLAGATHDEVSFGVAQTALGLDEGGLQLALTGFGFPAEAYRAVHAGLAPPQVLGQAITDRIFRSRVVSLAEARAAGAAGGAGATFLYDFRWPSPLVDGQLGAPHCIDIPFAFDEVFLDYHVVRRHDGVMDLIIVAVKKSKVNEYVGVVEEAGLRPVIVDMDGFALGNQFEVNRPEDVQQTVALIDMGAAVMKTAVVQGGVPIFARDIPFGGNQYTQAIADRLHTTFEHAERAKVEEATDVAWDAVVPALEAVSRELALEVRRTFDYFGSTSESERIGRVVMSGGAARLRGLTEYLSSTWSIPVEVARPLERIDVDPALVEQATAAGPALAVAVGLALRHPGERRE